MKNSVTTHEGTKAATYYGSYGAEKTKIKTCVLVKYAEVIGDIVSKETVCCVGGKVKH